MKTQSTNENFAKAVERAAEAAGVNIETIAKEAGLHVSTLYRNLKSGVSKPTAVAVARAINKLSGRVLLKESDALRSAGFSVSESETEGNEITEQIFLYASNLPEGVQEDVLLIVKALHEKYGFQK